ncbi:MAG: hypothetical protein GY913_28365 [Proteobacteria bacterium]|nr:hypothetical protein [Pseudomonadota bacterium]MCP4920827.1 hypothetical protein [Pseudomonadota bacterium]
MILLLACTGSDVPPDSPADSRTGDSNPPGPARAGVCDLSEQIALVEIEGYDGQAPTASVRAWDKPNPRWGAPELSNDSCDFHRIEPCGDCGDQVCGRWGCADDQQVVRPDFTITVDGVEQTLDEDNAGYFWARIDEGTEFGATLGSAEMPAVTTPSGDIRPSVSTAGDYSAPGELTATWTDAGEGASVTTWIDINHHAYGEPTFTRCVANESAGEFTADAEMIDPLAIITGLEFQGVVHERLFAADTDDGCVQFRVLRRIYVSPE